MLRQHERDTEPIALRVVKPAVFALADVKIHL